MRERIRLIRRLDGGSTGTVSGRRSAPGEDMDRAADALEELVVLLKAGLSWEGARAEAANLEWGTGRWARRVEAVLRLSRAVGAPLAPALARQATVLRATSAVERDVAVAAAGPRATARIVGLLPLGGATLAMLLGFDVLGAVTRSPLGWAMVALGGVLTVCGARWTTRTIRAAQPDDADPGLLHDLVSVALSGGVGAEEALRLSHEAATGVEDGELDPGAEEDVRRLISLVRRSGASLGPLLDAQADVRRRRRALVQRLHAETLGARLLAPLGLCALPAFLLLGVVPAVLAVVSSTLV